MYKHYLSIKTKDQPVRWTPIITSESPVTPEEITESRKILTSATSLEVEIREEYENGKSWLFLNKHQLENTVFTLHQWEEKDED
jgi:hypothetical protein